VWQSAFLCRAHPSGWQRKALCHTPRRLQSRRREQMDDTRNGGIFQWSR